MKLTLLATTAALAATTCALVGCSNDDTAPGTNEPEVVRSSLERDLAPKLTPAEQTIIANGEASFAVDIFRAVAKKESGNVFLSPHSISIALGMTYAGARGDTAAEMKKTLHLDLPDDRVHTGFNYLDLELASRGANAAGKDGKPFRLGVSNSFWGQKGTSFEPAFLDTLAVSYGAGINLVDFANETEKTRTAINGWVEKKTEDRIKDLLQPGSIGVATRAVLVNAVYFNAAWLNPFTESSTAPAAFTALDGSSVSVPTMHVANGFPYAKGEGYEAIELPYDGRELGWLAIVPDAGTYATFEAALTGEKVLDVYAGLEARRVELAFPKLKLEASFSLRDTLIDLGMKKAFAGADFSGISKTAGLSIGDVIHKTFLDLDEKGTEAAAATAVVMPTSAPVDDVKLNVDRPFITAIVDKKTKTLVFLGRIAKP